MANRGSYSPGSASGARIDKDGDNWTLVIERRLRHSPEKVWLALTEPEQLSQWAPYDADVSLGSAGATVKLTTARAPIPQVSETTITRAEKPRLLEFTWGGNDIRWELEAVDGGTRLTLWHNIDRRFIAMGAAGWHICLDVMEHLMDDQPIGRMVGADALESAQWRRLHAEYATQFGIKTPGW